jgi:filamentous hemagglutinin family protein
MRRLVLSLLAFAWIGLLAAEGFAQIVRDGTIGPDLSVQPVGPDFMLPEDFGELHGTNLFHSFGQFDLSAGESATFTGTSPIDNVLSRVTGPSASTIGGLIRSTIPGANVFLMNPHGITFTPSAQLNIDGSFHATTGDYLEFGSDETRRFYANPALESVLSPTDVSSFGFLSDTPASITVQETLLTVPDSRELSLIGGDLTILGDPANSSVDNAQLGASGGRIDLVSLGSSGKVVRTQNPGIQVESSGTLGTILLDQGAIVSTLGEGGGTIVIRAGTLLVKGDSGITSKTEGAIDGAPVGIDIDTTERVLLENSDLASSSSGAATSGDIVIRTGLLEVSADRTYPYGISARAFGSGTSGDIDITANRVVVSNGGSIVTDTELGGGNGGSIRITAQGETPDGSPNLEVTTGGYLSSSTYGAGNTGSMTIVADRILIQGGTGGSPGLYVQGQGTGSQGSLGIDAGELRVLKGGVVDVSRFAPGEGGDHHIRADRMDVIGFDLNTGFPNSRIQAFADTGLTSGAPPTLTLEGGNILVANFGWITATNRSPLPGAKLTIRADAFKADFHAEVLAITGGAGRAGELDIEAGSIEALRSSFLSARASTWFGQPSSGDAGKVHLRGDSILLDGRSTINASSVGSGGGGDVLIDLGESGTLEVLGGSSVESVVLSGKPGGDVVVTGTGEVTVAGADLNPDSPGSSAIAAQTGDGGGDAGSVVITARIVRLLDAGTITTDTFGTGNAGNIEVNADEILISGLNEDLKLAITPDPEADPTAAHSKIVSDSQPLLEGFQEVGELGPEGAGNAGTVTIRANVLELTDGGKLGSDTLTTGNAGGVVIDADRVSLSGNSTISSRSRFVSNAGAAGDIDITARDQLEVDSSSITSTSEFGASGSIAISETGRVDLRNGGTLTTSSRGAANAGSIVIGPGTTDVILQNGRILTTAAFGFEEESGRQGNIEIYASGLVLMEAGNPGGDPDRQSVESEITASVDEGLGGNITIQAPTELVLRDASAILAETDAGTGGSIRITADAVLREPGTRISADAGVGASGLVVINSPEVNVEAGITALPADFLNASALLRPGCAARTAGEREGSFVVASRRGMPASPEGLLLAFDSVGYGEVASATEDETPPVGGTVGALPVARAALSQGATAFRGGQFEEASRHWTQASDLSEEAGDLESRGDALRGLAQTQQALGRYAESLQTLRGALAIAEQSEDRVRIASALGNLGNAYIAVDEPELAEQHLLRGIKVAKTAEEPGVASVILNNLGNHRVTQANHAGALVAYRESAELARQEDRPLQAAKAFSNAARAALRAPCNPRPGLRPDPCGAYLPPACGRRPGTQGALLAPGARRPDKRGRAVRAPRQSARGLLRTR